MPNYETLRNSGQKYNLLVLKILFCFKNVYFIPIQWFRVCKLLTLKSFLFVCNSFVTLVESGLVGKVPELSILKKTVLNVNSFGLNGNWYGLGESNGNMRAFSWSLVV